MRRILKIILPLLLFLFYLSQNQYAQTGLDNHLMQRIDSSLSQLVNIQKEIKNIHPCLEVLHPVAIIDKDSLLIFDFYKVLNSYKFVKKTEQPFPMPDGFEASFPLSVYDNIPVCVISMKTFKSKAGFATIFHEFIHCCQFNSVELELKESLEIYKNAMQNKDYSWEIMHTFPYDDSVFINLYEDFKEALKGKNIKGAKTFRNKIKERLNIFDFEYMLWEEWKEGLARYVENKIRSKMGIEKNNYGKYAPYDRVAFYYSGEELINVLLDSDENLLNNFKLLFNKMKEF